MVDNEPRITIDKILAATDLVLNGIDFRILNEETISPPISQASRNEIVIRSLGDEIKRIQDSFNSVVTKYSIPPNLSSLRLIRLDQLQQRLDALLVPVSPDTSLVTLADKLAMLEIRSVTDLSPATLSSIETDVTQLYLAFIEEKRKITSQNGIDPVQSQQLQQLRLDLDSAKATVEKYKSENLNSPVAPTRVFYIDRWEKDIAYHPEYLLKLEQIIADFNSSTKYSSPTEDDITYISVAIERTEALQRTFRQSPLLDDQEKVAFVDKILKNSQEVIVELKKKILERKIQDALAAPSLKDLHDAISSFETNSPKTTFRELAKQLVGFYIYSEAAKTTLSSLTDSEVREHFVRMREKAEQNIAELQQRLYDVHISDLQKQPKFLTLAAEINKPLPAAKDAQSDLLSLQAAWNSLWDVGTGSLYTRFQLPRVSNGSQVLFPLLSQQTELSNYIETHFKYKIDEKKQKIDDLTFDFGSRAVLSLARLILSEKGNKKRSSARIVALQNKLENLKNEAGGKLSGTNRSQVEDAEKKLFKMLEIANDPENMPIADLINEMEKLGVSPFEWKESRTLQEGRTQKLISASKTRIIFAKSLKDPNVPDNNQADYLETVKAKMRVKMKAADDYLQNNGGSASANPVPTTILDVIKATTLTRDDLLRISCHHPVYGKNYRRLLRAMTLVPALRKYDTQFVPGTPLPADAQLTYDALTGRNVDSGGRSVLWRKIGEYSKKSLPGYDMEIPREAQTLLAKSFETFNFLDETLAQLMMKNQTRDHNGNYPDAPNYIYYSNPFAFMDQSIFRYLSPEHYSAIWLALLKSVPHSGIGASAHDGSPESIASIHELEEKMHLIKAYINCFFDISEIEGSINFPKFGEEVFFPSPLSLTEMLPGEQLRIYDKVYDPDGNAFLEFKGDEVFDISGTTPVLIATKMSSGEYRRQSNGKIERADDFKYTLQRKLSSGLHQIKRLESSDNSDTMPFDQYYSVAFPAWASIMDIFTMRWPDNLKSEQLVDEGGHGEKSGFFSEYLKLWGSAKRWPGKHMTEGFVPLTTFTIFMAFARAGIPDDERVDLFVKTFDILYDTAQTGGLSDYKKEVHEVLSKMCNTSSADSPLKGMSIDQIKNTISTQKFRKQHNVVRSMSGNLLHPARRVEQAKEYAILYWKSKLQGRHQELPSNIWTLSRATLALKHGADNTEVMEWFDMYSRFNTKGAYSYPKPPIAQNEKVDISKTGLTIKDGAVASAKVPTH